MKEQIALYLRVSTSEQAQEGYSIGEQEERLTKYAEARGWDIYRIYSDPGFSGAKMERPALQAMIRDIEKGKINKVIVYKLDRLSRSQKDTLYLIEDVFTANSVDFISMTENFDTSTPFGKAIIGILSVFAQLEREQIKERMQMGLDARAREGFYHGGPYAPIGYDYVDGELIINEYEAMQVRRVYELAESGIPLARVVKAMEGYQHKHNSKWTHSAVRSVLTTPVYAGLTSWKGETYQGRHEAIVSEERFNKMRNYIETRDIGPYSKTPFVHTSLLGGLIFCAHCGARYYTKTSGYIKYKNGTKEHARYYMCYSRGKTNKRLIMDPNCRNKNYSVEALNKIVLDEIKKLAFDKEYFQQIIQEKAPEKDEKQTIENRLAEIDKQIKKLVDLYTIGSIDFTIINNKIELLNNERTTLEKALEGAEAPKPRLSIKDTKKILKSVTEALERSDFEEQREIVKALISEIIIDDEDIEIHWNFI